MTCQEVMQPGPDGFTIPGIAQTIPLMPRTTATPTRGSSHRSIRTRLSGRHPVARVGGERRTSVPHAWNVSPGGQIIDATTDVAPKTFGLGQEVTYDYIPDGPDTTPNAKPPRTISANRTRTSPTPTTTATNSPPTGWKKPDRHLERIP